MSKPWPQTTIGQLCEVVNGGTPRTNVSEYWGGDHRWITPAEMGKRQSPYVSETERTLTESGLRNSSATILPPHSVIMSSRAPIGHLVINTAPMGTNQGCKGIVPGRELHHKFLYYYLSGRVDELNALGTGATFKELSAGKLKEFPIPLAPLAYQERIVRVLDEAFEGIAVAKANAEKNLQNARMLFQSELDSVFYHSDEKRWKRARLGDVCKFENGDRGKNYPNRTEYVASGIPWINTGHIRPDGSLSLDEMNFITREKYNSLRSGKIRPGDLVYCLRGATLGKTAYVDPFVEGAVASSLVIIRPSGVLNRRFLYYFLTSPHGKSLIKLYDNGAAQPNLGAKSVAKYLIGIPTLAVQQLVIDNLDTLAREIQQLENICRRKLIALNELKESLLHHAFTGKL